MLDELQKALAVNQKVQVTVWDPASDDQEITFPSYMMEVKNLSFLLAVPVKEAEQILPLLQIDLVVGVVLESCPKPFIFYPVIRSQQLKPPGFWLEVRKDAPIEVLQDRRHVRIPMVLPLQVTCSAEGERVMIAAHTEDVSAGGMKLTSTTCFQPGQELQLTIQFSPDTPRLQLKAKVVFSTESMIPSGSGELYTTACQFYGLDDEEEKTIVRECFRRELALKRT